MFQTIPIRWSMTIGCVLATVLAFSPALAQNTDDNSSDVEIEMVGTIDAIDGNMLTVNGFMVRVEDDDLVDDDLALAVGMIVEIDGDLLEDGMIEADDVDDYDLDDINDDNTDDGLEPGEIKITGVVTLDDEDDRLIMIGNQTIRIDEVEIADENVILADDIELEVRFTISDDDERVASKIDDADDDEGDMNMSASETQVSEEDAIQRVLEIYPNTSIVSIELVDTYETIWQINTSHGLRLDIDAETGIIYVIESARDDRDDDDDNNSNDNTSATNNSSGGSDDNDDDNDDGGSSSGNSNSGNDNSSSSNDSGSSDDNDDDEDDGDDDSDDDEDDDD